MSTTAPIAVVDGWILTGPVEVTKDPAALDSPGVWVVVAPFDGDPLCARFAQRRPGRITDVASPDDWHGHDPTARWHSSLDRAGFTAGVRRIRETIDTGELDQVNLTRRCSIPVAPDATPPALAAALDRANPAPYAATVWIPGHDVAVVSVSPERFLEIDGDRIMSSPIKGTTTPGGVFPAKDLVENRLVTAMVADELATVCVPGSVRRTADCAREAHPGLDHLVSTVEGTLRADVGWADVFAALGPPASVTGTPRAAARALIDELEPVGRGPYCGTIGIVDNERHRAVLNVAIRTFWFAEGRLHFGTGAGITAGSDPEAEWAETELKASRLLGIAVDGPGRLGA